MGGENLDPETSERFRASYLEPYIKYTYSQPIGQFRIISRSKVPANCPATLPHSHPKLALGLKKISI